MRSPSRKVSGVGAIICPKCEIGRVSCDASGVPRCDFCRRALREEVFELLGKIVSLPDAVGSHACECGHPEMRLLPGNVFWCPACGSEVVPAETEAA